MAYNLTNGNGEEEDLLHFVIEELYKCDNKRLEEIIKKKQMTFYVARIMVNQYYSKTSRYFKKYKKYCQFCVSEINNNITESIEENEAEKKEQKLNWIEEKLKDLHWFDSTLFKIYYADNHSLNSLSEVTKINRNTIYHSINKVKKYLKNER